MSRQLRIEYPGALYHVTARGNCRSDIFKDSDDRSHFLDILADTIVQFRIVCHAYCLMSNHYHLLIETPEGNLSAGMHRLNSVYASYFNWKNERVGHLFQGRFNAVLVQKESYLLELCRYILMNPVRAGVVTSPEQYRWSSYRETVSRGIGAHIFLTTDWILRQFDEDPELARRKFSSFVSNGSPSSFPKDKIKGDIVIGDIDFISSITDRIETGKLSNDIKRKNQLPFRTSLNELFGEPKLLNKEYRDKLIIEACTHLGYTHIEVARYLSMNRKTVSRVLKRTRIR
jgi:REP element-mobilizing transposase RayT